MNKFVQNLKDGLNSGRSSLIAITGPTGCGKSNAANVLCNAVSDSFTIENVMFPKDGDMCDSLNSIERGNVYHIDDTIICEETINNFKKVINNNLLVFSTQALHPACISMFDYVIENTGIDFKSGVTFWNAYWIEVDSEGNSEKVDVGAIKINRCGKGLIDVYDRKFSEVLDALRLKAVSDFRKFHA